MTTSPMICALSSTKAVGCTCGCLPRNGRIINAPHGLRRRSARPCAESKNGSTGAGVGQATPVVQSRAIEEDTRGDLKRRGDLHTAALLSTATAFARRREDRAPPPADLLRLCDTPRARRGRRDRRRRVFHLPPPVKLNAAPTGRTASLGKLKRSEKANPPTLLRDAARGAAFVRAEHEARGAGGARRGSGRVAERPLAKFPRRRSGARA